MKNLTDKIKALKESEAKAWENYQNAFVKECNSLLKRFGNVVSSEKARLVGVKFAELKDERREACKEENQKTLSRYNDYAIVAEVVTRFEYIQKLRQKWLDISYQLTDIEDALRK